jgi:alanine dehydrogenase
MHIGVPRESKDQEFRVGMTPDGVRILVRTGHRVSVEAGAGEGSGFPDASFETAGARIVSTEGAWSEPEFVVKVKEPNRREASLLSSGQVLFTYLHLAAEPELAQQLCEAGVIGIAYETIQNPDGAFPVLAPMSEVAGRLATQIGVTLLQKNRGGKGLLVGGVPGVMRGRITVIGAGVVGINAVRIGHALGADVAVLDVDLARLTYVYDIFRGELDTLYSSPANIERLVTESDLVVGAVYVHGRRAPTLVTERMVAGMEPGSVVVDVAVDQGGCIETIRPTTHSEPTYVEHGVVHYGVANMPGAVPRTSTFALTNTTFPYVERIAASGVEQAVRDEPALRLGANVWQGHVVCEGVAESLGLPFVPLGQLLGSFEGQKRRTGDR